ncbi:MAG: AAA family ATPase [Proteobacteria bacterium]|nr:AAA family ATPase [Pseudomonadota bacterium]
MSSENSDQLKRSRSDSNQESDSLSAALASESIKKLKESIGQAIYGQEDLVTEALCCLFGGGHLLMTGAPGLAKTTLVRVFASSLGLKFGRVQFTPDLLPSDIVGSEILNVDASGRRSFEFSKGPVFTNLLLADEINRASPRTQSALLESMQEKAATIGGQRYVLPSPFLVFATQNPFESEGTFPLPEAQLDRFLIHSIVPYPSAQAEKQMLEAHSSNQLLADKIESSESLSVMSEDILKKIMVRTKQIPIEDSILNAIADLVRMTRPSDPSCPPQFKNHIWYGAGPRAGMSLVTACKSFAMIHQSESIRWAHVRRMAKPVLRHRIKLAAHALRDGITEDSLIDSLLDRIQAEKGNLALGLE